MDETLARQLRRLGLTDQQPPNKEAWAALLARIGSTYQSLEGDRVLLERALEVSSREMTEQNESLRRNRDEALEIAAAKSQFLANMSHEIRTPMNGVIGMASLLLDTELDETQRDFAQMISNSAASLMEVINDVLDFSKIESGKLEMQFEEFSVRQTVEEVVDTLAPKAFERGLELFSDVDFDIPELVVGDSTRVRQILNNLLGNAIKFTHEGHVVVKASATPEGEGYRLALNVSDTGIGIPADRLEAIFESFTQGDGSTTRRHGGTGLGLTISRQLAEMMGGHVNVQSCKGQGSSFTADLFVHSTLDDDTFAHPKIPDLRVCIMVRNEELAGTLSKHVKALGATVTFGEPSEDLSHRADLDLVVLEANPKLDQESLEAALRTSGHKAIILCEPRAFRASQGSERTRMVRKPVKRDTFARAITDLLTSDGDRRGRPGGVAA